MTQHKNREAIRLTLFVWFLGFLGHLPFLSNRRRAKLARS